MAECLRCGIELVPRHPTGFNSSCHGSVAGSKWEGNWYRIEYKNDIFLCIDCTRRRIHFTEYIKRLLCENQKNQCANCHKRLLPEYLGLVMYDDVNKRWGQYCHVDHKQELTGEGDNDLTNLQLLCLKCHKKKTKRFMEKHMRKQTKVKGGNFDWNG
jgi:hypothetical protein